MFAQLIESWSADCLQVWTAVLPRQALLLFGVALLVRAFPRLAASWRHWIWLAAALAVGVLPVAAAFLPAWPLIPAEWVYGAGFVEKGESVLMTESMVLAGESGGGQWFGWVEGMFLVWLLGVMLLLGRLAAGMVSLKRFQACRVPLYQGRLRARLERCRALMGMPVLVDLYISGRSTLPMTWGVRRPAINVPEDSENWSDERLDAIFLHELGHIQRADCWTNMLLKTVCALNWFNPLVWMAARRTYLAQEVACDDVACERLRASDYARHLLELTAVVEEFPRRTIEPAVGLSSSDHLRFRVGAVLDPTRRRDVLPSGTAGLLGSGVFLLMGFAAMVSVRFVDPLVLSTAEDPADFDAVGLSMSGPGRESSGSWQEESSIPPLGDPAGRWDEDAVLPPRDGRRPAAPGRGDPWWSWETRFPWLLAGTLANEPLEEGRSHSEFELLHPDGRDSIGVLVGPMLPEEVSESDVAEEQDRVVPMVPKSGGKNGIPPSNTADAAPLPPGHIEERRIDWRDFQRRVGERRGRSVLLTPAQSIVQRYARLSAPDREREGGFRRYLRRSGLHLNDGALRDLLDSMPSLRVSE